MKTFNRLISKYHYFSRNARYTQIQTVAEEDQTAREMFSVLNIASICFSLSEGKVGKYWYPI